MNRLFDFLKGCLGLSFFILNTIFWCLLLYPFAALKMILPSRRLKSQCTSIMVHLGQCWIHCNSSTIALIHQIKWDVKGTEGLDLNKSYLICANHQSWVDIVVLQHVLNKKIPFLRFFLKKQLLYIPFLGLAWWALDFPFMNRYSNDYLKKHPEKRGRDLAVTRQACEKFRGSPISILNFLEGTRFTQEKHDKTAHHFKHLLPPKVGGVAFVLQSMGDQFASLLDVTIFYPQGNVTLWDLLCGRLQRVTVRIKQVPIPPEFAGEKYLERTETRGQVRNWVHGIWQEKDQLLIDLKCKNELES